MCESCSRVPWACSDHVHPIRRILTGCQTQVSHRHVLGCSDPSLLPSLALLLAGERVLLVVLMEALLPTQTQGGGCGAWGHSSWADDGEVSAAQGLRLVGSHW